MSGFFSMYVRNAASSTPRSGNASVPGDQESKKVSGIFAEGKGQNGIELELFRGAARNGLAPV
jgi:hypothetical protein